MFDSACKTVLYCALFGPILRVLSGFKWSTYVGLFLRAAAALSRGKHLHHLWRAWYIFYWLEIICEIQRNEDLPIWLVLWLTNVLNAYSWASFSLGLELVCVVSQAAAALAMAWDVSAIPDAQHAAFEQWLSMLDIIKCQGTLLCGFMQYLC